MRMFTRSVLSLLTLASVAYAIALAPLASSTHAQTGVTRTIYTDKAAFQAAVDALRLQPMGYLQYADNRRGPGLLGDCYSVPNMVEVTMGQDNRGRR